MMAQHADVDFEVTGDCVAECCDGVEYCDCVVTRGDLTISGYTDGAIRYYGKNTNPTGGTAGGGFDTDWRYYSSMPTPLGSGLAAILKTQCLSSNVNGEYETTDFNATYNFFRFTVGTVGDTGDPGILLEEWEWWLYCDGAEIGHGYQRSYLTELTVYAQCNPCETSPEAFWLVSFGDYAGWYHCIHHIDALDGCAWLADEHNYDGECAAIPDSIFGSFYDALGMPICTSFNYIDQGCISGLYLPNAGWGNLDPALLAAADPPLEEADCCELGFGFFGCPEYGLCETLPVTVEDFTRCEPEVYKCDTQDPPTYDTVVASLTINGYCPEPE